jgi:hypothetical protein
MAMDKFEREWLTEHLAKDGEIRDGVLYWKSVNRVTPVDTAENAVELGYPVDMDAHKRAREADIEKSLAAYRKARPRRPSAEELYEMRAAFGEGATVVNILTGERITV